MTDIRKKNWFRNTFESMFHNGGQGEYVKQRYIQVYDLTQNKIVKGGKIVEEELTSKIRSYMPGWKTDVQINSIYTDRQNDKDGELGIVTECGCFLTLRDKFTAFNREPLFLPNASQLGECQLLTSKKLDHLHDVSEQKSQVLFSLGYENLTLMDDSLLWIGEERIHGVVSSQIMG